MREFISKSCNRRYHLSSPMSETPNSDLQMALAFIIGRIDEQAYRSGEPLDGDERFLLGNLPTTTDMQPSSVSEFGANLAPRDLAFEKLVRLAKAVHHYDLKSGTQPASDWNFATAVSKLNRHPISWLL